MSEQLVQARETHFDSMVISAAVSQLLGGGAAIVLAILGLVQYVPADMAAVAAIVLGGGFALNGGLLGAERSRVMARVRATSFDATQFNSGIGVEVAAGIAAIVLGIMALLRVEAAALIPIATLVLGVGLVVSSAAIARLNRVGASSAGGSTLEHMTYSAVAFAAAFDVLAGLGAIVLAILALVGIAPMVSSLAALLALGGASVLSGASVTSRMRDAPHRAV